MVYKRNENSYTVCLVAGYSYVGAWGNNHGYASVLTNDE